jgi:hypothetical protein
MRGAPRYLGSEVGRFGDRDFDAGPEFSDYTGYRVTVSAVLELEDHEHPDRIFFARGRLRRGCGPESGRPGDRFGTFSPAGLPPGESWCRGCRHGILLNVVSKPDSRCPAT